MINPFFNLSDFFYASAHYIVGCANKDLWALCAPIFIIVVYSRTATSYFLGGKE